MVEWAGAGGARSINKYYVDEAVMEMEAQERRCHAWVGSDGPLNGRTDDLLGTGARAPVRAGATADARLVHGSGDTDRGTKGERQHNDNHQGQGGGVRHANSSMLRR